MDWRHAWIPPMSVHDAEFPKTPVFTGATVAEVWTKEAEAAESRRKAKEAMVQDEVSKKAWALLYPVLIDECRRFIEAMRNDVEGSITPIDACFKIRVDGRLVEAAWTNVEAFAAREGLCVTHEGASMVFTMKKKDHKIETR